MATPIINWDFLLTRHRVCLGTRQIGCLDDFPVTPEMEAAYHRHLVTALSAESALISAAIDAGYTVDGYPRPGRIHAVVNGEVLGFLPPPATEIAIDL